MTEQLDKRSLLYREIQDIPNQQFRHNSKSRGFSKKRGSKRSEKDDGHKVIDNILDSSSKAI